VATSRASAAACAVLLLAAIPARAETITVHAGKQDTLSYGYARQFAEALALAGNGAFTLVVEESQGSIQNVMDINRVESDYVFTATPGVIAQARHGDKPFDPDPHYAEIRSLFPIPAQLMHWVVRQDGKIHSFAELAGQSFIPGSKGSAGERVTTEALQAMELDKAVRLIDADASGAPAALKDSQIGGFALAASIPAPAVNDLANAAPIRLLGLPAAASVKIRKLDDNTAAMVIPKGTYKGIDYDVATIGLPSGAFTTIAMTNSLAYALTKAFWTQQAALAKKNPAWAMVAPSQLEALGVRVHAGALRYYNEAHIPIPANLR
jgi:uncharacterized protein